MLRGELLSDRGSNLQNEFVKESTLSSNLAMGYDKKTRATKMTIFVQIHGILFDQPQLSIQMITMFIR
jgi:hypothetical protein